MLINSRLHQRRVTTEIHLHRLVALKLVKCDPHGRFRAVALQGAA